MRLGLKFMLAFLLGNTLLAGVYGYLAVRREVRLFQKMVGDEAGSVGSVLANVLPEAWRRAGQPGVQRLINESKANPVSGMRIRWVWFDVVPGGPDAPWTTRQRLTSVTIEQHLAVEDVEPDGTPAMLVYWPVALNVSRRGGLEFSHPTTELELNERDGHRAHRVAGRWDDRAQRLARGGAGTALRRGAASPADRQDAPHRRRRLERAGAISVLTTSWPNWPTVSTPCAPR